MQRPLEPHDHPGPTPSLSAEEFRAEFTEEMRREIQRGLEHQQYIRKFLYMEQGMTPNEAAEKAHEGGATGRKALQLLGRIAPEPYQW